LATDCPEDFTTVVKQGLMNVTAAVSAGTYSTGVLAPGAKKDVKVLIKLVRATTCTEVYFYFATSSATGSSGVAAHVVTAA
jgi:hypothetical protein